MTTETQTKSEELALLRARLAEWEEESARLKALEYRWTPAEYLSWIDAEKQVRGFQRAIALSESEEQESEDGPSVTEEEFDAIAELSLMMKSLFGQLRTQAQYRNEATVRAFAKRIAALEGHSGVKALEKFMD